MGAHVVRDEGSQRLENLSDVLVGLLTDELPHAAECLFPDPAVRVSESKKHLIQRQAGRSDNLPLGAVRERSVQLLLPRKGDSWSSYQLMHPILERHGVGDSQRALNEVSVALLAGFLPLPSLNLAFCRKGISLVRSSRSLVNTD